MPQPDGLELVNRLLQSLRFADWSNPTGPIRLSTSLTVADLAQSDFFQNTRLLLNALKEGDGTPATAKGNLNRAFLRKLLPELRPRGTYNLPTDMQLNEVDLMDLHLSRVISEIAGLIIRKKKHFQLTTNGRQMLADDQAGQLYRLLFLTYFRKFNVSYEFWFRDVPDLQSTMAAILWRLDSVVSDWRPVKGLASEILLPAIHRQLRAAMTTPYDTEEFILGGYVLHPLLRLGLIEREKESRWGLLEENMIRVSPLWRKFIAFF